jgi:hypothetical protein
MTLVELKKSIHEGIDHLNDEVLLEQIKAIIDHKEKVFEIPEKHLNGIIQGKNDIKNGNFLTEEELHKRYEKWLKD